MFFKNRHARKLEELKEKNRHEEEMERLRQQNPVYPAEMRQLVENFSGKFPRWTTQTCTIYKKESKTLDIKVRYLENAHELEKIEQGDWIDMYLYEDVSLKAGDFALLNLGVSMALPQGYEAILAPRSSTFKKYGILQANSIGVIDNSYCGDNDIWRLAAYATRDINIPKDTRLCQFRVQAKQPAINFISVDSLGNEDRGGFGSTGD